MHRPFSAEIKLCKAVFEPLQTRLARAGFSHGTARPFRCWAEINHGLSHASFLFFHFRCSAQTSVERVGLAMSDLPKRSGLQFGPVGANAVHLCVDMQRLFGEGTPWNVPWMEKVLPTIVGVVAEHPERTIFTRFVPVERPEKAVGSWKRYSTTGKP